MNITSEVGVAAEINMILGKYPREQRFALAVLQDIQNKYNYLPKESLYEAAAYLSMPLSKLYGMATFYKALSLEKKGEYIIKVCDGTACHIRSSAFLISEIEKALGIKAGYTTADGRFSLETVSCLGSCALAPVMVINDKTHGSVTAGKLREILKLYGGHAHGE
ncbi:NADH-quinone oxidoreductase subunit NuoE family protein [Dethiobacter alkaliphilus]|uniref:NADH-quinone oxidoreductase subunit NuoE family protein n=1 Tax=Dethiobacter alkaliphilus TaxID=427926 RepID=UPI002227F061|nr:NAD(P)H-dependent oxidoreductase subunit E [Dethiobacter alkaliphilus]MCW3490451.1 NAD(P)H-dependent oxidoreductase subunit E [Dethiobacter alkaliphilus]